MPDPTPRPLDHLTLRGAPAAPALVTREGGLDYAGLETAVGALAGGLRARGLAAGDRIASWLPKTRLAALLPLAAARAGLVHVPVNPLLKRGQVAHILSDSGARLMIGGAARLASLDTGDLPAVFETLEQADGAALLEHPAPLPPSDNHPADLPA